MCLPLFAFIITVILGQTANHSSTHFPFFSPFCSLSEQGPSSFIVVASEMTWHQAQSHCRSMYTDLVTVRTESENDQLTRMVSRKHWIGLHRERWAYWSDHNPTSFTNWNIGQPDNSGAPVASCAMVDATTGKWLDTDCEESHFFICQSPLLHRTMFKLKFESDADLNDPAIQQQILEQVLEVYFYTELCKEFW